MTSALLLDVEGTTTPIDFVANVLFPFARQHVKGFVARHREAAPVRDDLALLRNDVLDEAARGEKPPVWADDEASVEAVVHWLMDRDRKSTGLKSLQGRIWEEGYRSGELRAVVFDDVPPALQRWSRLDRTCAIYSSGSVLAQKLLFSNTQAGDLTPLLRAHFDTTIGPKKEAESYRRIARELEAAPAEVLFLSDVRAEVDAAATAGMKTRLCVRPGNAPADPGPHAVIRSFSELTD